MSSPIPARLARLAQMSPDRAHARRRAIQMYREWYRSAPEMVTMYALDAPPSQIRHFIRERFEANRHVDDLHVIDRLLHQSRVNYQEAMNGWLPSSHVKGLLLESKLREQKTFLQKFFAGRDGEQVIPAPADLR